jgi:hypothetical protein
MTNRASYSDQPVSKGGLTTKEAFDLGLNWTVEEIKQKYPGQKVTKRVERKGRQGFAYVRVHCTSSGDTQTPFAVPELIKLGRSLNSSMQMRLYTLERRVATARADFLWARIVEASGVEAMEDKTEAAMAELQAHIELWNAIGMQPRINSVLDLYALVVVPVVDCPASEAGIISCNGTFAAGGTSYARPQVSPWDEGASDQRLKELAEFLVSDEQYRRRASASS